MAKQPRTKSSPEQSAHREAASDEYLQPGHDTPFWMVLAAALPAVLVPLFVLYIPAGFLVKDGYGLVIINEYQKYAAELFTLGITLSIGILPLVKRNNWPHIPKKLAWASLCFFVAIGMSLFQAVDLWRGILVGLQVYLLPALFFLIVATRRWTMSQGLTILGLSLAAGGVVAIIGIAQGLKVWDFALALPHYDAGSLLFFRNIAGEYLITLIPPAIAIVFMPIRRLYRISAACVSLLLTTHLVLAMARGAWVGLIGGLFVGLFLAGVGVYFAKRARKDELPEKDSQKFSRKRILFLAVGMMTVLLLVAGIFLASDMGRSAIKSPYVKELLSINLSNTTGRLQIWSDSLDMLKEHWLGGVGPGHYKVHMPAYLREVPTIPYLFNWDVKTGALTTPFRPHNDYLQTWLELGLAGIIGLIWLFATISWITTRGIGDAVINGDRIRALMILGTFSGFAAWTVSMLFEFPFHMPASLLLGWLCAGVAVSFSLPYKKQIHTAIRPFFNRIAGVAACILIFSCFLFAHQQFWSDVYCNQAIAAGNNQDLEKSYEWITKAYKYTPWKEQASGTKARQELVMGKPEEALITTRETLLRNPNSLPALWANGLAAGMLGHEQESRAAFQKIVTLYPFLPEIEKYRRYAD